MASIARRARPGVPGRPLCAERRRHVPRGAARAAPGSSRCRRRRRRSATRSGRPWLPSTADASAAGRFTVGRQIRSHSAEMAAWPWPCCGQPGPKVCWSSTGSFRSSRARARAARPRPNRALEREKAVAEERTAEVQRGAASGPGARRRGRGHRSGESGRAGRRTVTSRRSCNSTSPAEPIRSRKLQIGGAAAQEDVLAVVHHQPVVRERPGEAAEPAPLLEQGDLRAGVGTCQGSRDAGQATSDDDQAGRGVATAPAAACAAHAAAFARAIAATVAFSPEDRLTLPCSTLSGFIRMRSSRRW